MGFFYCQPAMGWFSGKSNTALSSVGNATGNAPEEFLSGVQERLSYS
jgi:hypothetical protein